MKITPGLSVCPFSQHPARSHLRIRTQLRYMGKRAFSIPQCSCCGFNLWRDNQELCPHLARCLGTIGYLDDKRALRSGVFSAAAGRIVEEKHNRYFALSFPSIYSSIACDLAI